MSTTEVGKPTTQELKAACRNIAKLKLGFDLMQAHMREWFYPQAIVLEFVKDVFSEPRRMHRGDPEEVVARWGCNKLWDWEYYNLDEKEFVRRIVDRWVESNEVEIEFYPLFSFDWEWRWGPITRRDLDRMEPWACDWLESHDV